MALCPQPIYSCFFRSIPSPVFPNHFALLPSSPTVGMGLTCFRQRKSLKIAQRFHGEKVRAIRVELGKREFLLCFPRKCSENSGPADGAKTPSCFFFRFHLRVVSQPGKMKAGASRTALLVVATTSGTPIRRLFFFGFVHDSPLASLGEMCPESYFREGGVVEYGPTHAITACYSEPLQCF